MYYNIIEIGLSWFSPNVLRIQMKKVIAKLPWDLTGHQKNKINKGNKIHLEVDPIFFKKSKIF